MLFDYLRILKSVSSTLTDISYDNQEDDVAPVLDLGASDFFLIGMQYPFNNFFIFMSEPNDTPATMTLEYWNGSSWVAVVDLLDGTSLDGASLGRSGHVLFSPDKQESGWLKVNNPQIDGPDELDTTNIYDLYWLKVSFSTGLNASTSFEELGFAWTTSAKLKSIKPEVDRYLNSFEQGKEDWIPEIMTASKMVATEFKKANLILGPQQIIRLDDFWIPTTYKALWLIYSALGPAYKDQADALHHQFYKTMNVDNITVDQNQDGRVSDWEKNSRVKVGVR